MNSDKQLREQFDKASVKDLMPDFDVAAGWQDVSRHLKPGRIRIPLTRYLPYAAAIAAILLLLVRQNEDSSHTLVAFRSASVQAPQPGYTPGQAGGVVSPARAQLATKTVRRPAIQPMVPAMNPVPLPDDSAEMIVAVEPSVTLQESLPVRHYADIAPVQTAEDANTVADRPRKGFLNSRIARRRITHRPEQKRKPRSGG